MGFGVGCRALAAIMFMLSLVGCSAYKSRLLSHPPMRDDAGESSAAGKVASGGGRIGSGGSASVGTGGHAAQSIGGSGAIVSATGGHGMTVSTGGSSAPVDAGSQTSNDSGTIDTDTDAGGCDPTSGADCCPADPNKTAPGACGCGIADTDMDGDGTPDCHDACIDDNQKTSPGVCGCGFADVNDGCLGLRAALVHRYSFEGSGTVATDSKGTANGTIVNTSMTGTGALSLAGTTSDQYVDLPNHVLSTLTNATLEAWVTWSGGALWQRIFDIGSTNAAEGQQGTGETYLFLTPHGGTKPNMRLAFTTSSGSGETVVDAPGNLPSGGMHHVAVVVDDDHNTLALYQDGAQVGTTSFSGHLSSINDVDVWLGRSLYSSDPEFAGTITEFRMYDVALDAAQLSTSYAAGPDAAFF